jgi:hypothetical protein
LTVAAKLDISGKEGTVTASAVVAFATKWSESVTLTITTNDPLVDGLHISVEVSLEVHPCGSPPYAYENGAVPPDVVTFK